MFNEALRLKERHKVFNVNALKSTAEAAFKSKHGPVTSISKLAEGGFNRVFTLQLHDGFEIIAKLPYHIAVPKCFTTASEVATLDFLRTQDISVPEVYEYSTTCENAVGSEYILMSKATGVSLTAKWQDLSTRQIKIIAHSFVEMEKKLFEFPFSATGSIYYKKDLPPELRLPIFSTDDIAARGLDRFCIGPLADYMFWYGRRETLNVQRGPWRNPVDFLNSTADKEIEWAKSFGSDQSPSFPYNTMGLGKQSVSSYVKLLEDYKRLTPHLLPKNHPDLLDQPTLRHPDLTPANIIISSETDRVSCLIDWQHAVIQPRLLAAGYPIVFANPETEVPRDLVEPSLPKDIETLPMETQAEVRASYRRQALFYFYRVFNGAFNKPHLAAIRDPLLKLRQHLVDRASRQWNGNLVTLKGVVIRTTQFWNKLAGTEGVECPVHFDEAEVEGFLATESQWLEMSFAVENWRDQVCFMNEDGWVSNEDYQEATVKLKDLTELVWSNCKGDEEDEACFMESWPFRDHDEVD